MKSVPDKCLSDIKKAARQVACKRILPWCLEELRLAGLRGMRKAEEGSKYDKRLGAPFEQQAGGWIARAAEDAGERLQASAVADELPEPSNEQIRDALRTFSIREWRNLIGEFRRRDVDVLRAYLDANRASLEEWLGHDKFNAILSRVIERGIVLTLMQLKQRGYEMTAITDALWAAHIHNDARRRNIEGAPRPSKKRPWSEVGRPNNIAESLSDDWHKVTSYKARMMLARMEQTPFEEFDGDFWDYLTWATNPKAYAHDLRLREADAPTPPRNPDPYFSTND